jgi:hypothetical protein
MVISITPVVDLGSCQKIFIQNQPATCPEIFRKMFWTARKPQKAKILIALLEKEGINPVEFDCVLVPAGIDIGSEAPEEIGSSIAAELIIVRKNLDARRLKDALHHANN